MTMRTAELMPHREAIVAFLKEERAHHAKHRKQAVNVLHTPHHEDASQASGMLHVADTFIQEVDDLMEVFTSGSTLSEFTISQMIMHKMFDALRARAAP
jgi:predicted polyphosphate/ATP-dependent NAD kinase